MMFLRNYSFDLFHEGQNQQLYNFWTRFEPIFKCFVLNQNPDLAKNLNIFLFCWLLSLFKLNFLYVYGLNFSQQILNWKNYACGRNFDRKTFDTDPCMKSW